MKAWEVAAHNFAVSSENKIHDDAVAATYGFEGGLVPGVGVFGYLSRPVLDLWGDAWLEAGSIEAKFLRPTYDGDDVRAVARSDGEELVLELLDSKAQLCAVGKARRGVDESDAPAFAPAPLPEPRWPPVAAEVPVGKAVGSLELGGLAAESPSGVIDRYRDDHPRYAPDHEDLRLHPAFFPDQANTLLAANVALGPWIHTESRLRFLAPPSPADDLRLQGVIASATERRGHEMVTLELEATTAGHVVARLTHTAIVKPRRNAGR
ncbi:MAG: hypothetical protein AAGA81_13200 [Acidobacteriota bacterium]